MAIPTQNEFLLPFLDILSDGKTYTRGKLLTKLAEHFKLSPADIEAMSGRQYTLVNRVAWCDVYFVKAGFITKKKHAHSHLADEFRITMRGLRELERNRRRITVGYLQSFYRGKVYRGAGADDSTSEAERQLRQHRRAAIVGGAGTGKTLLALEKAGQLAEAGYKVLFLCFNRNLVNWIKNHLPYENITVNTFHGLVYHMSKLAKLDVPHDMDAFNRVAADLLLDAVEMLRLHDLNATDSLYDAIIVDEAQDFDATWWVPLPSLLNDPENGVFYVFFDDNQRLYTQLSNVPIEGKPFFLDENCRNTQAIHERLGDYTTTSDETVCIGPEGRPIEVVSISDEASARRELSRLLHRLIQEEGIAAKDIVLLTAKSERRSQWKEGAQIGNYILTWDLEAEGTNIIRVCTIYLK